MDVDGAPSRRVKFSISLPRETYERARELAGELGWTLTEVMRIGVEVEDWLIEQQRGGSQLLVEPPDGQRLREVHFPHLTARRQSQAPDRGSDAEGDV